MTEQRKDEIIRHVFYRHIDTMMRDLEKCEDTNIVFYMGLTMGMMYKDLEEELDKELKDGEQT